jgi:AcrR family transcriptional regulator
MTQQASSADAPPHTSPRSPRSPRGAHRREAILDAARDVFAASGYRAASVRDIAAAAAMSHPGLLRHFSSKAEILVALIERAETENTRWLADLDAPAGVPRFADIARRNAADPAYAALFTALCGEAGTADHPFHARMAARYARLRALSARDIRSGSETGLLRPGLDPEGEATRIAAAWDGLQVLTLYLDPAPDIPAALDARERMLRGTARAIVPTPPGHVADPSPFPAPELGDALVGYAPGRARRARIVADAMRLFTRGGFASTSMQEIADAVGVSKSTLFHHYPSKDALLLAVLQARDAAIAERSPQVSGLPAADALRTIVAGARENSEREPGLIEVYAVLSCEASPADHPAHAYFARRFEGALAYFTGTFVTAARQGTLAPGLDPAAEALWLLALWDGLQFQWMYAPDEIDIAAHLAAHLDQVLTG